MLERKNGRIKLISPSDNEEIRLYDLSESGIGCYHSQAKEKDSYVLVKINELSLRAKVAYCQKCDKKYRLGLQFWNILPQRQAKINDIVEKYSKGIPVQCEIIDEEKLNGKTDIEKKSRKK